MNPLYIPSDARIFILTGAGISVDSGISGFRGYGGLWGKYNVNDVATRAGFDRNPEMVNSFYNKLRTTIREAKPNAGHHAIALLQKRFGNNCTVVTQNVDDLHERAGSFDVIHMHGSILKARCRKIPNHVVTIDGDITDSLRCPECNSRYRPHIVWFGESPHHMPLIQDRLSKCTHFFAVGTSGSVYPAGDFRETAYRNGAETFNVNIVEDEWDCWTNQVIGSASETLPILFSEPTDED